MLHVATPRVVALLGLPVVFGQGLAAQSWEFDLRSVHIDHDPPAHVADTGEQIPTGFGLSLRYVLPDDHSFVDVEWSNGTEARAGAVCGGFVQPGDCVREPVLYSGGVLFASAGWLARVDVASRVRLGVRARLGIGALRAKERGLLTDRDYSEVKLTGVTGVAAEAALLPTTRGPWITFSTSADALWPFSVDCLDCRNLLRERLPQYTISVGVSWYGGR